MSSHSDNLHVLATSALLETDAREKCKKVDRLVAQAPSTVSIDTLRESSEAIDQPGVPEKPELVHPRDLHRRGSGSLQGRVTLLLAIAHIEFNAINLALDAVVRFAGLPRQFYLDWMQVAADEARHFRMICQRLSELGAAYGDVPAHKGLWDMALRTAHDPLDRMAMVPRIMEARGLDVTPHMITKFDKAGDRTSANILSIILDEEIAHVEAGTRWFQYLCEQRQLHPTHTWTSLVSHYLGTDVRCPTNLKGRQQAGFKQSELDWLRQACRNQAIQNN